MPRKPLNTDQEKVLYLSGLIGFDKVLHALEKDVKSHYKENPTSKKNSNKEGRTPREASINDDVRVIPIRKIK